MTELTPAATDIMLLPISPSPVDDTIELSVAGGNQDMIPTLEEAKSPVSAAEVNWAPAAEG